MDSEIMISSEQDSGNLLGIIGEKNVVCPNSCFPSISYDPKFQKISVIFEIGDVEAMRIGHMDMPVILYKSKNNGRQYLGFALESSYVFLNFCGFRPIELTTDKNGLSAEEKLATGLAEGRITKKSVQLLDFLEKLITMNPSHMFSTTLDFVSLYFQERYPGAMNRLNVSFYVETFVH